MTSRIEHLNEKSSRWRRLSDWLGTLDSGLDLDPIQHSLNEEVRKVARLEARVNQLELGLRCNEDSTQNLNAPQASKVR